MRYSLGDAAWAEDLEQEVVLRIWQKMDTLSALPDSAAEKAWVVKVTKSVLDNISRKQHVTVEKLSDSFVVTYTDEYKEKRELLEELGAHLPPDDRQLLELLVEGYHNKEIAKMLSLSANTVGVRVNRMVAKLREIYDKLYNNVKS